MDQEGDKTDTVEMTNVLNSVLTRLQLARGVLWESNVQCKQSMANPLPTSRCGWGMDAEPDMDLSLARTDLYCETITWQYNEMGASDNYMKNCKNLHFRSEVLSTRKG